MSEIDNSAGNPFAAPVAQVQDAAPIVGDLAGRGARFLAFLIDTIFAMILGAVIMGTAAFSLFSRGGGQQPPDMTPFFGAYALFLLVYFVIQGVLLWKRSQTIGKIAMSIRIVRSDGSPARFARLLWMRMVPMFLVGLIPLIGALICLLDCLMIFRESRRCLHDDIADTVVIRV